MKRTALFLFATFCLLVSACTPASTPASASATQPAEVSTSKTPQALQPTVVSTALFQVVKADGTSVGVTVADLKKLPLAQVTVEGRVEEGPKLLDVLTFAGVTDFTEVTLTGSSSPVTLTREQVDHNTILDFTNHGTMKLSTTYVPKPDWTKDITEIIVK